MRLPTLTEPSAAERVHNACAHTEASMLAIYGAEPLPTTLHQLRACGDIVVALPCGAALPAADGAPAVLELTDYAPIPLREPVRSLVWLRGSLRAVPVEIERRLASRVAAIHPHPALLDVGHTTSLLRLALESAVVADMSGAEPVDLEDLRLATPDPFREYEATWLRHLDSDHPDVIECLAHRLPAPLRHGRVRPLAIDRYGITLRVEHHDGDQDARVPFPRPVHDVATLGYAVQQLIGCPPHR